MPYLQRITRRIGRDPVIQSGGPFQEDFLMYNSPTNKLFERPGTILFLLQQKIITGTYLRLQQ
jgi:hypothetical protein